jgi:hypothetical protein
MGCSLSGSSVHGILPARMLAWVAISFPAGLPDPGMEPGSPSLKTDSLLSESPGKPFFYSINLSCIPSTFIIYYMSDPVFILKVRKKKRKDKEI